jgi:Uma2 family endonuclease
MATVAPSKTRVRTPPSRPVVPELYRININEYERIARAGALDDDRIELIDGYLVRKMPKYPRHVNTVARILRALQATLPGWWCRKEDPVRIPDFDEPEPDVAVVRGSIEDYQDRTPGPKDIALLVEVADTTLPRDRGEKAAAYGRGRIPVYWIINLVDRQIEVYSRPSARGYRSSRVYQPGEDVPVVIAGAEVGRITVADVLPRARRRGRLT